MIQTSLPAWLNHSNHMQIPLPLSSHPRDQRPRWRDTPLTFFLLIHPHLAPVSPETLCTQHCSRACVFFSLPLSVSLSLRDVQSRSTFTVEEEEVEKGLGSPHLATRAHPLTDSVALHMEVSTSGTCLTAADLSVVSPLGPFRSCDVRVVALWKDPWSHRLRCQKKARSACWKWGRCVSAGRAMMMIDDSYSDLQLKGCRKWLRALFSLHASAAFINLWMTRHYSAAWQMDVLYTLLTVNPVCGFGPDCTGVLLFPCHKFLFQERLLNILQQAYVFIYYVFLLLKLGQNKNIYNTKLSEYEFSDSY